MVKSQICALLIMIFSFVGVSKGFAQDENPYAAETASNGCRQPDEAPFLSFNCCQGLIVNQFTGRCDEPPMQDTSLVTCSSNSDCTGGTACLPQSADLLFSNVSPSENIEELSQNRSVLDMELGEYDSPRNIGQACNHPAECKSYSCEPVGSILTIGRCTEKKVCRFAAQGEVAASGVNCGRDLVKNSTNGICEPTIASQNPVYDLPEVNLQQGEQCRFDMDEQTKLNSYKAMKALRAMEWMLATTSLGGDDDCFGTIPLLKDQVGKAFLESRKNTLVKFSETLKQIEFDFKQLITAKEIGNNLLVIHGDQQLTGNQLSSRQTSGYDSLMMMFRRNEMFRVYEQQMLESVNTAGAKISGLSQGMATWQNEDQHWNIGTTVVPTYSCKAKYKIFHRLRWKTRDYNETKNRWSTYYEVAGTSPKNLDIIKRDNIAKNLGYMMGIPLGQEDSAKSTAITEFSKQKYYLLDPMMHGGLHFTSYGRGIDLNSGGFFSTRRRDRRSPRSLSGDNAGSFTKIYNDLKPKIKEYYTALKTDPAMVGFVYEPELVSTTAKDCLDPSKHNDPSLSATEKAERIAGCANFDKFLDEVLDEGFAQWIAYSANTRPNYVDYFTDATAWRRRLFKKLEEDVQFITTYYAKVTAIRAKQNECIRKVIYGLQGSGILSSNNNGVLEGNYYDPNLDAIPQPSGSSNSSTAAGGTITHVTGTSNAFNLGVGPLTQINYTSLIDKAIASANSGKAGVDASAAASLAARRVTMLKANATASSKGLKIPNKDKAVKETISSMNAGGGSMAASSNASSTSGGSSQLSGASSSSSSISNDKKDEGNLNQVSSIPAATSGSGSGGGTDLMMGETPSSSQLGNQSENTLDTTGLSEREKDQMMSEYQRTKKEYRASEEDGIFSKVSKAYVRNLDKILTRKKTID